MFDAATDPIGNGRAICRLCAREGARLAVADAREDNAAATLEQVRAEGGQGIAIRADVRQEDDVRGMFDIAVHELGGLDSVVFNVGIGGRTGLDIELAEWDKIINTNLRGALLVGRGALDRIESGGSIVLISSVAGFKAGSQMIAYDASKAGLTAIMRQLALMGSPKDIRVNTVVPGLVDTPVGRFAAAGRPGRGRGEHLPFRRQATGWEIAYAVLFFLCDESAYVTGQHLAVDSGMLTL